MKALLTLLIIAALALTVGSCGPGDPFGPGRESKELLAKLQHDPAIDVVPPGAVLDENWSSAEISSSGPGVYRRYCSEASFGDVRSFYVSALGGSGWRLRPARSAEDMVVFTKRIGGRDATFTVDERKLPPCAFNVVIHIEM